MAYRYFYDTEFLENGRTIELISFGMVNEDGEAYYAVNADAPWDDVMRHQWLVRNVVPHLPLANRTALDEWLKLSPQSDIKFEPTIETDPRLDRLDTLVRPGWVIANEVREFLAEGGDDIELWANWGAYDHVALMQLYGPMIRRPSHIPMFTNDIQQAARMVGAVDRLPEQQGPAHNAMEDALHVKHCYDVLAPLLDYGKAA